VTQHRLEGRRQGPPAIKADDADESFDNYDFDAEPF